MKLKEVLLEGPGGGLLEWNPYPEGWSLKGGPLIFVGPLCW